VAISQKDHHHHNWSRTKRKASGKWTHFQNMAFFDRSYSDFALDFPSRAKVVAVAEPEKLGKCFNIILE